LRIGLFVGVTRSAGSVTPSLTIAEALAAAQQAEQASLDSFWLPNIFALDALTTPAAIGGQTERIELGTNVVPVYPRHPMALAQQALTTSVLTADRFTLGIGLSHKFIIERTFGLSFDAPSRYMRDYLSILSRCSPVTSSASRVRSCGPLATHDRRRAPCSRSARGDGTADAAAGRHDDRRDAARLAGPRTRATTSPRRSVPRPKMHSDRRRASVPHCRFASPTTSAAHIASPPSCSPSTPISRHIGRSSIGKARRRSLMSPSSATRDASTNGSPNLPTPASPTSPQPSTAHPRNGTAPWPARQRTSIRVTRAQARRRGEAWKARCAHVEHELPNVACGVRSRTSWRTTRVGPGWSSSRRRLPVSRS
jgi:hypothetical protein